MEVRKLRLNFSPNRERKSEAGRQVADKNLRFGQQTHFHLHNHFLAQKYAVIYVNSYAIHISARSFTTTAAVVFVYFILLLKGGAKIR